MKSKIIAAIIVLIIASIVVARIRCNNPPQQTAAQTLVPKDTNFTPVREELYRPPSLPFQKHNPPAKLPEGLRESDVDRIVSLKLGATSTGRTIELIETKDGQIFVRKDSALLQLTETRYRPPILAIDPSLIVGVSFAPGAGLKPLPLAGISLLNIAGSLKFPFIALDGAGVGIGAGYKLYHDIQAGIIHDFWRFDDMPENRLAFYYSF